jgi:hypothetical protein
MPIPNPTSKLATLTRAMMSKSQKRGGSIRSSLRKRGNAVGAAEEEEEEVVVAAPKKKPMGFMALVDAAIRGGMQPSKGPSFLCVAFCVVSFVSGLLSTFR